MLQLIIPCSLSGNFMYLSLFLDFGLNEIYKRFYEVQVSN